MMHVDAMRARGRRRLCQCQQPFGRQGGGQSERRKKSGDDTSSIQVGHEFTLVSSSARHYRDSSLPDIPCLNPFADSSS
jgi:hypothetical protein